ncbi:CRISPR-associated protein Csn2-St [Petrocella sp. FN5]|uniref:CRISPR-associated protein Csn2-St n=1 Tax=Petrocella sp. FN5 TaxID=3032002 RepID=UPI0023DC5499|nr:CRISPR-associated protein Csn2-St [Petrocella sp. FN5]MDF1618739.1 CRISPR-associated protein Csn2-St [Petrocella sp. FN5]
MSLLSVRMTNGCLQDLELGSITQIVGMNDSTKEYIINSLTKHFSKYKYSDDEYKQENNILLDGLAVGRSYYHCSILRTMNDLYYELSQQKSCLLVDYVNYALSNINVSYALQKLNDELLNLGNEIKNYIQLNSMGLDIELIEYELMSLLKNQLSMKLIGQNEQPQINIPIIDKLMTYIELLQKINEHDPIKRMIIFHNIDRMLDVKDYIYFINQLRVVTTQHDFAFILTTSKEGYISIDQELIESINVVNNFTFNVDSFEQLKTFIVNHYPYHKELNDEELIRLITPIIHKIGYKDQLLDVESQVILKMINSSENIVTEHAKVPNLLALEYIQSGE